MRRIRVALAELPAMLHDIVQTVLAAQPDVELVPLDGQLTSLALSADMLDIDVVIFAHPQAATRDYSAMLYAHPRLRLIAISIDGRAAAVYELQPQRIPLGELSPETLIQAVRASAQIPGPV
jgi:hypothetical protein